MNQGDSEEGEVYVSILLDGEGKPTQVWYVEERGFTFPNDYPRGWYHADLYDIDLPFEDIIKRLKQEQVPNNWNVVINKLKKEHPAQSQEGSPPYNPLTPVSPPYNPLTPVSPPYNPLTPVSPPSEQISPPYNPVVFTPQTPSGTPPPFNPQTPSGTPPPLIQYTSQPKVTEPVYIPVIYTPQSQSTANNTENTQETTESDKSKDNEKESQKGGNVIKESNLLMDIIDLDNEEKNGDVNNSENNQTRKIINAKL